MTLTSVVNAQTNVASFTVVIKDPCKRSIFETSTNPLSTMTITMPSGGSTTQTVKVWTDVERATSPAVICPITGVLAPGTKAWISFANPTVSVDHTQITLPTDIGTHAFTITADS